MPGLGRRLSRLPRELTALFCVILRQSPRRGCSRTSVYAPPPDGGFSLSDAKISPSANRGRSASKYRAQRISVWMASALSKPSSSDEGFVVLKHASNKLFVSGVILTSPSFPPGFPPPCPIRVQSSHHAGLTAHPSKQQNGHKVVRRVVVCKGYKMLSMSIL